MSSLNATRLRYVSASTATQLADFISGLPFKVEIKSIVNYSNKIYAFFVIPELEGLEFGSVDL